MNLGLVFFQFLPLFLYLGFSYWKGFRAGIIAAIVGAVLLCGFNYLRFGDIDGFALGEALLIVLMGMISLQMKSDRLFKMQPTVLAALFVSVLLYFEFKGTPLLVRYIPQVERLLDANSADPNVQEALARMHTADYQLILAKLSRAMIFLFLIHGLIMAYAALHLSTAKWFFWRMMIYPGMLLTFLIVAARSMY